MQNKNFFYTYILDFNLAASQLNLLTPIDKSFGCLFVSNIVHEKKVPKRLVS